MFLPKSRGRRIFCCGLVLLSTRPNHKAPTAQEPYKMRKIEMHWNRRPPLVARIHHTYFALHHANKAGAYSTSAVYHKMGISTKL